MQTWFFTEDAYPYLPDADTYESIRVNLPNKYYDPDKGTDLYHMYLDRIGKCIFPIPEVPISQG